MMKLLGFIVWAAGYRNSRLGRYLRPRQRRLINIELEDRQADDDGGMAEERQSCSK